MSELLPYENELADQLHHIPLPDENMAWADMKRRLDKDDDNIIPIWWRGCALWSLLALLLIVAGWWFLKYKTDNPLKQNIENARTVLKQENKQNNNTQSTTTINTNDSFNKKATDTIKSPVLNRAVNTIIKKDTIVRDTKKASVENYPNKQETFSKTGFTKSTSDKIKVKATIPTVENDAASKVSVTNHSKTMKRKLLKPGRRKIKSSAGAIADRTDNTVEKPVTDNTTNSTIREYDIMEDKNSSADSVLNIKKQSFTTVIKDSLQKTIADTAQTKKSSPEKKKDSTLKEPIWFSAGLAINQQLPIAGQTLTSYNAEGRKGNLADYIPSVYARMYKGDKWFIQAEFRYGAPQNTKDIVYQNRKDTASGQAFNNDTTSHLKKTYYNQLSITFNYFIRPNWSVGGGFIWNKFTSAVSEQQFTQHNNITDSNFVISKTAITNKRADSNFVSSYFQYVLETQYRWKRLSLGIRYTFGLQPYLKFTLPGGTEQKEKSQSVLFFIRYELWRSKRK